MKRIQYYRIKPSVEPSITGVNKNGQIYDFIDSKNTNRERLAKYQASITNDYLSKHGYDLNKFKLQDAAKLTNMLSSNYLNISGIFISEKLKSIIDKFKVYKSEIFPTKLQFKNKEVLNYYYLNALDSEDLVDFEKTEFVYDEMIEKMRTGGVSVKVNDLQDYKNKNINPPAEFEELSILPKKICLKDKYDLLHEPFSVTILISKDLKDAILASGINDVEIKEIKYEEYSVKD